MNFFTDLTQNKVLLSAVTGWLVAQILKTIIHLLFTKKFVAERLVGSGGMPSSHSATVCALATATCYFYGAQSFEFAIAVIMAIIVMYDAMGVRRETGIQARVLNEMMQLFADMGSDMPPQEKLKEFVGHTPLQVVMGALLGIIVALFYCVLL
ncbi:MAG: divergent PAP2 family protein [Lachnospiraceae bacterium]